MLKQAIILFPTPSPPKAGNFSKILFMVGLIRHLVRAHHFLERKRRFHDIFAHDVIELKSLITELLELFGCFGHELLVEDLQVGFVALDGEHDGFDLAFDHGLGGEELGIEFGVGLREAVELESLLFADWEAVFFEDAGRGGTPAWPVQDFDPFVAGVELLAEVF